MLDFNDTPSAPAPDDADRGAVRAEIIARLEAVLLNLFPAGRVRRGKFYIGDVLGSPGDSLEVVLEGEKAGLWTDRAEGSGGDIFDLIAAHHGLDTQADFGRVLDAAGDLLGRASSAPPPKRAKRKAPPEDDLGPATAKWDYLDADGRLIAVVYRYDPPGRKKEFRPWDARRRRMAPPEPRPLYNQPGMKDAAQVVLVEGEKCAQALIDAGICATTAMHGANAPVEKTDWSPLAGKHVLVWPDRDKPGWDYAMAAAQAALAAGATSCDVLLPPEDKPEGWDAADALDEGFDVAGFIAAAPRQRIERNLDAGEPSQIDALLAAHAWQTEDGLAAAFTDRHAEDWRYCAAWGKWLMWDGRRWIEDRMLYVNHLTRAICRAASRKADSPRLRAKLASAATLSAVERIARCDPRHAATPEEWDADIWLLNTPGGVVDLRSGRLRPHARSDRMTKITSATPRGDCPRWRAFLADVTGGDEELSAYLQRMVGYCLTGSIEEHALFFLHGTGANGKSVFVNVVSTILADYARHAPMETFMAASGERHPTELAMLMSARWVSAVETEQGARLNESRIKELTGGDTITARFMRQDFFTYLPQFKPVIVGNHKPAIRNIDEAMKRRLHLIPFTVTILPERRDPRLTEKLLAERDGIMAWAVEGCLAWQREGLKPPASVVSATEEYFEAEDALGRWIEERCVLEPNAKSLTAELFNDWKQWAEAAGEFVGSQKRFADSLLARGLEKWRNGMGLRGFQGIALKYPPTPARTPYADD
ncbi:MAG: hypothetical protein DI596_02515 [Azospira oryzae]|nr:MAG: hypothetical protein DI596_02515 [Azospira oryzae]PZP82160.1 MAG: hypothetical protein DI593_02515 [Azospira oryzae]